jgi:SAM-dependent methyltransferase
MSPDEPTSSASERTSPAGEPISTAGKRMGPHACEICGNAARNRAFTVREMMFGLREPFEYLECGECGSLQLLDVPEDLARFYPDDYYSLGDAPALADRSFLARAREARAGALLRTPARAVEALVHAAWVPPLFVPTEFMWLAGLGLSTSSAVCDVGSGSGKVLAWMLDQGFSNLAGFDPYIERDLDIGGRIAIRKLGVEDMPGGWDLIMLNHSFEHMAQPALVLERLRERLNDGGSMLIRIPLASSWAWRVYGPDWVQLDAPRHLFIHTQRSMSILAERAGMGVSRVFFDSGSFQFWGSEQYRRDIPHRDPRSYWEDPGTELFTAAEIKDFERRAKRLNKRGTGDSAGFVLRTKPVARSQPTGHR